MAPEAETPKWEGKATAKLLKSTAEAVWPHLEDFCSLNKWLPTIDTSYKVSGVDGQLGLVRYCATTLPPSADCGEAAVMWCHEKLTAVDTIGKWLSYEVLDNNMGVRSYKSTLKVVPINGGDDGCQIEWSFAADPIEGMSFEDLVGYIDMGLQGMATNLEKALEST